MAAKPGYSRNFSFWAPKRKLWRLGNLFILAVTLLLASSYLLAADPVRSNRERDRTSNGSDRGSVPVEPRYRVFALKHISVERAKKFLADAKLGTVSQLPATNMLLVTAQPRQLIKASAILKLVDVRTAFVMKAIFPASAAGNLPSNEQIAAEAGNISIGSFSNPPSGAGAAKAIIDVHDDAVVAIAPADQLEKIIEAIERYASNGSIKRLQKAKAEALQPAQPAVASTGLSPQKRKRLLDSLAQAEKKLAELAQPVPGGPEPNEPAAQPTTVVTAPDKTAPEAAKPPEKADLAAVPEKPVAEKIVRFPFRKKTRNGVPAKPKPGLEPGPETIPEQVAVEVEEPDTATQVVEPRRRRAATRLYQPEFITNGDDTLELDLPEKINIIDLLDLVGKYLNLNYMYDPADVTGLQGEVTLKLQGPIKVKDLYLLVESVLKFKKFVMTRRVNLVTIVPITRSADIDAPIVDPQKPWIQTGDVIITCIFKLKHIDTASAQNLLIAMKLGVSFSSIADMGTLIVSGYAYRMARIEELLEMVDKPGEQKKFRSRALEYTMAQTLATKVKTLAEQLGAVSITIGATAAAAPTPTVTRKAGESTAVYQRRLQAARAAAARRPPSRTTRAPTSAAEPTVYLDADERTNRILMIGLEEQLAIVDKLIDALDVEKADLRTLRLYEIRYVDAEDVRKKLEELGIIGAGRAAPTGTSIRRTPATRTTPSTRTTPTTRTTTYRTTASTIQEPLVEEPQVVIIEATNSLLVNATAEQHVQIAVIIGYVDAVQEEAQNPYVIYQLENQDPEELAAVLEKLISETITEKGGADSKVPRTTVTKRIEEDIIIVPDPKSYSLIIYASKKNQTWIASLIKELDEYRPQVLLDVTLVEITKNDQFSLDLDLISKFPRLTGGESMDFLASLITPFPDKRIIETVSTSGAGSGFYADEHIQLLLTAMQIKDYGRVLARPKLLVNDNEEGTIKAETVTTVVSPKTQVVPGTGISQATQATSVDLSTYTEGITLTITPHISKGDQLRLTIAVTRTDFGLRPDYVLNTPAGELTGPTPPDLLTSDLTSTVTVPDRSTIILGGLEKLKQTKGGTKVPLLGDIPILGGFFRSTANKDTQSRLYVFVKANILRPGEEVTGVSDVEVVSAKNRATFEKYEKEMQEYEDWPGIKPKPMDPLQVLEADEDEVVSLKQQISEKRAREMQERGVRPGIIMLEPMEAKQILEPDEALSLKNRRVFEKHKKEMQEGRDLPGTKPEPMDPLQILEADLDYR